MVPASNKNNVGAGTMEGVDGCAKCSEFDRYEGHLGIGTHHNGLHCVLEGYVKAK
jgi:hypothetical protein